jgi:hypothetical protein
MALKLHVIEDSLQVFAYGAETARYRRKSAGIYV